MFFETVGLDVSYGAVKVLSNFSMSIEEGEIIGILGPNGAGKTTLLMTISGILRPNKGQIFFEGKNLVNFLPSDIVRLGIAHCPEGRNVFPELTVKENLEMGAYTRKDKESINKDIDDIFERFSILDQRRDQLAGTLSGGEQQMLAISRSILSKPKLLLLDEPSLGLAPIVIEEVFKIIKDIHNNGVTLILVEQNARKALKVVDRAYIIESGKIRIQDYSNNLMNNDEIKKIYLGISSLS